MPLHVLLNLTTGNLQERVDWGAAGPPTLVSGTLRRWLLDNPPVFDPATQRREIVYPIADGVSEVPYSVTNIPTVELAARQVVAAAAAKRQALLATDTDMARVAEDLVVALLVKGVLARTDLPADALVKLNVRRALRGLPAV